MRVRNRLDIVKLLIVAEKSRKDKHVHLILVVMLILNRDVMLMVDGLILCVSAVIILVKRTALVITSRV